MPTVAGALLLLVAVIYAAALINAVVEGRSPGMAVVLAFFLVVPFAYTGAATIWRWRYWRAATSAFCWVMIILFVLGAFVSIVGVRLYDLMLALLIVVFFTFVLWAVRREANSKEG